MDALDAWRLHPEVCRSLPALELAIVWTHTDDRYSEDEAGMAPKTIPTLAGEILGADEVVVDGRPVTPCFWPVRHERIRGIPPAVDTRSRP